MRWTAAVVAEVVGGTLTGPDVEIASVTQDSREVAGLDAPMFVALVADRDGHEFVDDAVAAGAVACLVDESAGFSGGGRLAVVAVADTGAALGALGGAARERLTEATVVGITGSVGKTTTKDLLAAVLAVDRPTHASARSFNNEIGVPLTLLAAPETTRAVVVEMGARGMGHIARLCAVARPNVGIVTTVGAAHTSEFGSIEAVARGKGELVEALPDDGVAVLNADVPLVAAMADRTSARVVTFGADGDVRAEGITLDDELVPRFRLVSDWGSAEIELGARGLHLVDNALAAAAAALPMGLAPDVVAQGLATPVLSPLRMALERTAAGARVLNDSYNANPMSVAAALRSLARLPATRRIAVLGVMAELGATSADEHRKVAALARELGVRLVAVDAPEYGTAADGVEPVATVDDALDRIGELTEGDAVLVKGSRVAGLERLAAALLD